jgi:hypothetical protein
MNVLFRLRIAATVLMFVPLRAQAQPAPSSIGAAPEQHVTPDHATDGPWYPDDLFSDNVWGMRGGYRTQAARPLRPGALVVSLSDSFTSDGSMFARNDADTASVNAEYRRLPGRGHARQQR